MIRLMRSIVLILLVVASLSGCMLFPGTRVSESLPALREEMELPNGATALIQPITGALVRRQSARSTDAPDESGRVRTGSETLEDYTYRIGPRDILEITVWGHPELSFSRTDTGDSARIEHTVDANGCLFYPYIGRVSVEGLTVVQIRERLTEALSDYITDPQLDVRVSAYRNKQAFIVGEVARPGSQPITDEPLTVLSAVNAAGGVTENADLRNVTLARVGETTRIDLEDLYGKGDLSGNRMLRNGDVLYIPDRSELRVFLLGEVSTPGMIDIGRGRLSLAEALAEAGGFNLATANPGRVYVFRGTSQRPEVYHLNMRFADAMILADEFTLLPRDVVYVDTAGLARWNRAVVSQIAPTIGQIGGVLSIGERVVR